MNELRRMAYLDALGIDSYVSRTQLPGAAETRRLAIVATRATVAPGVADDAPSVRVTSASLQPVAGGRPNPMAQHQASTPLDRESLQHGAVAPRFSLVAIVAGDWLWLEELAGMPLTTEQVQLVQSMAQALVLTRAPRTEAETTVARPDAARPLVAQFDWPIHSNHQLDLGAEAARASVAGFVGRKLEQHECRGLVLLGQSCTLRVPQQEVNVRTVSTASTAEILAQPALKRIVWRDILPLVSTL